MLKELLKLDHKKISGSDGLDPFFFKVAAPIIAKPISDLWMAATLQPLVKGGDQADPNCYRPISILPCLLKVLEKKVNNQLTGSLDVYSILSGMQSSFYSVYGFVITTFLKKVLNDVTIALDSKQCCTAIFIDF